MATYTHIPRQPAKVARSSARSLCAAAFAVCFVAVIPVRSFAGDPKSDVSAAYAAFDAAFDKGDAKDVAALYLPNAKVLPPTHEVVSGPPAIEKFFAGLHASGVTDHKLEVIDTGGDDKVVYGTAQLERQRQGQGWQAYELLWHRHHCVRASGGWFAKAEVTYFQLS